MPKIMPQSWYLFCVSI